MNVSVHTNRRRRRSELAEKITISRTSEHPSASLALMLKGQYSSREFSDILAATEIREHEIVGTAGVMSARFVTMICATEKEDLQGLEGEDLRTIKDRLAIKKRIERNPAAMVFALEDTFLYAFGLLRQSLKRQSRKEAMNIAMSPRPITPSSEVGMKDKLLTKLGVSRKYKREYVEKG